MTLGERLKWLARMTLLVFILTSAAFLSAITAMRIAIHGREVTMPNLVGKNVSEASQTLQSRGLVLRVADRIYSDQPINVVVRQTPTSGLLMKVSQQAHVVLSLGQRQFALPQVPARSESVPRRNHWPEESCAMRERKLRSTAESLVRCRALFIPYT